MGDPIALISKWIEGLLIGWGIIPQWVTLIMTILGALVIAIAVLLIDIFLVWMERKVVARFQDRLGPNRLGPFGLIQPIADVIKLLIKENITPANADRIVYNLPPIIALATVIMLWAVIPLSPTTFGTDINVGVLYIVAIGAISTLGIIMAGWSSNNKYALLSAFRVVAVIISYEVPMVISLMVPVLLANSMGINKIVEAQSVWFIFVAPIPALIFLLSSIAELGRAPFDLAEAESEIVAGFHIEYTGMKFGLFYAGELLHALTVGGIFSALFLGGWRGPLAETYPILGIIYFFIKAFFMYWVIMWFKYSLPRIRIDQMLNLNWKILTPLSLAVLLITAILHKIFAGESLVIYTLVLLAANGLILWIMQQILNRVPMKKRERVAEPKPIATPERSWVMNVHSSNSSSSPK